MKLEHTYRGTILLPKLQEEYSFECIEDGIIAVDKNGVIVRLERDSSVPGLNLKPTQNVILPFLANTHDHSFQPPGIPGELIYFDTEKQKLCGWLPTTLQQGEFRAKNDQATAEKMIRAKLEEFARNGMGAILQYTTSSREAAEIVLKIMDEIGILGKVGYVCMDQGMDDIQKGLQTTMNEAIESTQYLLKKYGGKRIAVIDRFPIAVSSQTRKRLAVLARDYKTIYETHLDESANEKKIHKNIYGTSSIVKTLLEDGVFEKGSTVGLAHAIHTSDEERCLIEEKIKNGCTVFIRACPNSNDHLGSHWTENDKYIRFPLEKWEQIGAIITIGTDQGAGRGFNVFSELLDEKRRHSIKQKPSHTKLLKYGTINGFLSLGLELENFAIKIGNRANFQVVEMA